MVLPPLLDYHNCLAQARQLVDAFQDQIKTIHPDRFQEYADKYRQQFTEPGLLNERKYLIWFQGKDHLTYLCRRLGLSKNHYEKWAAEHVDIQKHPDLQQLVTLVN